MGERWHIFLAGALCGISVMFLVALDAIDDAFREHEAKHE